MAVLGEPLPERLARVEERNEAHAVRTQLDAIEVVERLVRVEEHQVRTLDMLTEMKGELDIATDFVTAHLAFEALIRSAAGVVVKSVATVGVIAGIVAVIMGVR